jgi:transposase InsO family protein
MSIPYYAVAAEERESPSLHNAAVMDEALRIIFDSGASSHMLPVSAAMTNYRNASGVVTLGGKFVTLDITGRGDTPLLKDVLHVPQLSYGLISIGQCDSCNWITIFKEGRVVVYDYLGKVVLTGTKSGNLYDLDTQYVDLLLGVRTDVDTALAAHDSDPFVTGSAQRRMIVPTQGYNVLELLHHRWGHASEWAIKRALRLRSVAGANAKYDQIRDMHIRFCTDCYKGRMRAFPSQPVSTRVWEVLNKVGLDWKGPFRVLTPHKERGFYLFADQQSHYLAVYLCQSRSEALDCLRDFKAKVVQAAGAHWQVLQADNDSVFLSGPVQHWLRTEGIETQLSAPYTHDQNGMVERDIQTVVDKARTMMAQYNTPEKYWGYAVQCAVYLLNCTSTPQSTGKTPHEVVFKQVPDVSHLVPFYAPGVYHLTKDERKGGTWAHKAEPCRMLGYAPGEKNSYLVLNVRTGAITSRRDCIFDESFYEVLREAQKSGRAGQLKQLFELFPPASEADAAGNDTDGRATSPVSVQSSTPASPIAQEYTNHNLRSASLPGSVSESDKFKDAAADDSDDGVTDSEDADLATEYLLLHEDWLVHSVCGAIHPDAVPNEPGGIGNLVLPVQPVSVQEALSGADKELWYAAIQKELKQLDELTVLRLADEQFGHGMKTKMVLRVSFDNEFNVKYKARLVCCGYSQVRFRDYDTTYSPTVSTAIVFLVLHLAGNCKLYTGDFDVSGAFLQAGNDYVNYAWLPASLFGMRLRFIVLKALYGEKQAPKLWSDLLDRILHSLGFERCPVAPCLYMWSDGIDYAVLVVHVDDGTLAVTSECMFERFMNAIHAHLPKVTLMRPLQKYLGIAINHDYNSGRVYCNQSLFISNTCDGESGGTELVPMCPSYNLRAASPNAANMSLLPVTGKLRYLCDRTRPDILIAAGEIACGGADHPSDLHVRTAAKTLTYLHSTVNEYLLLGGLGKMELFGFCDASYLPGGNSKSRLGGCAYLGYDAGAFASYSVLGSLVAQSSCHAEIQSIDHMTRLMLHYLEVLYFLGVYERGQHAPVCIFTDSASSMELCSALKVSPKTSAMNMRVNFIRECINNRLITLHFIPSKLNVADMLTKALPEESFCAHRKRLLYGFGGYDALRALLLSTVAVADYTSLDASP